MSKSKLPEKIKKLRGTDQPCRKSDEIDFDIIVKLPAPPKYFSSTAKSIYSTVGKSLVKARVLTLVNLTHFVQYCNETAIYMDSSAELSNVNNRIEQVTDKQGNTTTQVAAMSKVATTALQNALRLGREFGFTPASIGRIQSRVVKSKEDDFSKFLNS